MNQEDWSRVIKECQDNEISMKSWCEQNGIKYSNYRYWSRKLKTQPEVQQWAKLQTTSIIKNEIAISCGKWKITIDNETSIELLTDVIRAVNFICS